MRKRIGLLMLGVGVLAGCATPGPIEAERPARHLTPSAAAPGAAIPAPVAQTAFLPPPVPTARPETYTVVVSDVPVRELLFALARDARVNVDIHPGITGNVTLNAVEQTLPQILERLSQQMDIRYSVQPDRVTIAPDTPFLRTYRVDYLNLERTSKSSVSLSTEISSVGGGAEGGGSGGRSGSSTDVSNTSDNTFWKTLIANLGGILELGEGRSRDAVVANPEAGIISVRATERQHRAVQEHLDRVLRSARRQVLIEATIVEVALNDQFQAGIDWTKIANNAGFSIVSGNVASGVLFSLAAQRSPDRDPGEDVSIPGELVGGLAGLGSPYIAMNYQDPDSRFSSTLRLLQDYGDTRVLSSPKLMAINNQTAVLKVVDNEVYFEITQQIARGAQGQNDIPVTESKPVTVPVGIVMQLTPQIADDRSVTLTVRPTISRIKSRVADPVNPGNLIPLIVVREMDSVLRLNSGQTAILGGLMQDSESKGTTGVPGLSRLPGIGYLFQQATDAIQKTELVVFLRPLVIEQPSIEADLAAYRGTLERTQEPFLARGRPPAFVEGQIEME